MELTNSLAITYMHDILLFAMLCLLQEEHTALAASSREAQVSLYPFPLLRPTSFFDVADDLAFFVEKIPLFAFPLSMTSKPFVHVTFW